MPAKSSMDIANALAIQPDGKIDAAGSTGRWNTLDRYNSNGSLDTTFNGTGSLTTVFGVNSGPDSYNALVIQPDGRILAVGESAGNGFAFARYNPIDGSADTTFGSSGKGKATASVTLGNDVAKAVAVQTDGRIVTVGTAYNGLNSDFALVRLSSNGATYDINITTSVGSTHTATAKAVVIQSDGKIVTVGSTGGITSSFALVRYLP